MIISNLDKFLMQSLQLTSAEDYSESSVANTHIPKSKNDNQKIEVEYQRSDSKWFKVERKKWLFYFIFCRFL